MGGGVDRICKDNAAICLFSAQPFTTKVISSNLKQFKYCWYWVKNTKSNFPNAKIQPLRSLEEICVFYKKQPIYNPQGIIKKPSVVVRKNATPDSTYTISQKPRICISDTANYPTNVLQFKSVRNGSKEQIHQAQKPVELCEYLIKTYTNVGDTVLDFCAGSGTTLVAAKNLNRHYIGFEINSNYYNKALERIKNNDKQRSSKPY